MAASWLHLLRVSPALHPPERTSHTHTPKPGVGGRGHEFKICVLIYELVSSPCRVRPSSCVVVDSHIRRIFPATEETTATQQVSYRPIKCQSRSWSQRGTNVNWSHHGGNPLVRPTGIQTAPKRYAALQAMAPTNVKTIHQTSLPHTIESNLDQLGLLSPTHGQRSQQQSGQITLHLVLITKPKFLKATHRTEIPSTW